MSKQSDLVSVSQGSGGDPLYIDTTNDRVGVGTTSPSLPLEVYHATNSRILASTGSTGASQFCFGDDADDYVGRIYYDHGNNSMRFHANTSERMRIDSGGNVFINSTNFPVVGIEKFGVNGSTTIAGAFGTNSSTNASVFIANNFNGTSKLIQFSGGPLGNTVGTITTNGSTTTSYNTSSDYRLKENVTPLEGAADRLAQIPVHRFNFIADPDTTVDGFLAHEVQAFVPEAITGEKDGLDADGNPVYQGIDQSKLVPLLTAALQEALQKIDALEARVAALEAV